MKKDFPGELLYSPTHAWVRVESDMIVIGITDHAQQLLGDIVFVELPELEKQVQQGQEMAVVESVKTAADVYSPVTGTVVAINEKLQQNPNSINEDPYGEGWICRLKFDDNTQLAGLLDADHYKELIAKE